MMSHVATSRGAKDQAIRATGVGSWPGGDPREAIVTVRDLLLDAGGGSSDGHVLPYLPETPARGPGSDIIGRGAGVLTDLPVELQPSGWRLTGRPGRDAERTASLWRQDLDELTEAYDGYRGLLKVAVAGPWTLASSLELPGGEKAIVDVGAAMEIAESLADGILSLTGKLGSLLPGVSIVLQLDEPSLPAVLSGTIPTASGFGRLRAVDTQDVLRGLQTVTRAYAGETLVHCCLPSAPIPVLRQSGARGLSLDLTEASAARWESVAATVEAGQQVYAGLVPTDGDPLVSASVSRTARVVMEQADRVGIATTLLRQVVISPTCGLAGLDRDAAIATQHAAIDLAAELNASLDER